MKNLTIKVVATIFISGTLASCVKSGHRNQPWHSQNQKIEKQQIDQNS